MTLTIFIAIGLVVGWFVPRMMAGDGYGIAVDLGVASAASLLAGFIFKAALGGWVAGAIAAVLLSSGCVFGMRQVKNVRDKQQATAAREAMRRRQARGRQGT